MKILSPSKSIAFQFMPDEIADQTIVIKGEFKVVGMSIDK